MPGSNQAHSENQIPCRTCTDFKTWTKLAKQQKPQDTGNSSEDKSNVS